MEVLLPWAGLITYIDIFSFDFRCRLEIFTVLLMNSTPHQYLFHFFLKPDDL